MTNKISLNYLKKIPIEIYVLAILPFLGIVWMIIFYPASLSLKTILFYLFFGDNSSDIIIIVFFLYIYLIAKIIFPIIKFLMLKEKGNIKDTFSQIKNLLKAQIYFLLIISFSGIFANLSVNNLFIKSTSEKIIWSSNLLMDYDYFLFGKDLLFWTNNLVNEMGGVILSWILVELYKSLTSVFVIFFLILLIGNKNLVKKYIIFFFLIVYISTPIWYLVPATGPIEMHLFNTLKTESSERIVSNVENYQPASALSAFQKEVHNHNKKYGDNYMPLTAFPSMHAGWGLGIVLYGFMLYWPSIFVLLPWFLLQAAGAIYTGQHYLLDIFLGMIMAAITYFLIEIIFYIEKKYYNGKGSLFIIDIIQNDFKNIFNHFKKSFSIFNF